MRKLSKILLSTFLLMMLFSTFASLNVVAIDPPDDTVNVSVDTRQQTVEANIRTMFRFRDRTQLTFQANVNLDLNMDCEALQIGVKDFVVEIDGVHDLQMNMTCTREEEQLGLQMGNTYRIRNRNTYQYQEGFCCYIECNGTFTQARIRIQATNQNRVGTWAYYDEATSEWVSVPTTIEDEYLTATITHFSYWTILIPENTTLYIIIGVSIAIVAAVIVIGIVYLKRRK
ncbi:MAG: hypothetical protein ACFFEO_05170 [Candidatus Thorarchaeota archaeon]